MEFDHNLTKVHQYFENTLKNHGATAQGADWNSPHSQEVRFDQLMKVIEEKEGFTLLDYGCGYGAMADYLIRCGYQYERFVGYDILEAMITQAKELHTDQANTFFTYKIDGIPIVDYATASGVFNIRLDASYDTWTQYALDCMQFMFEHVSRGFSVNFLTRYSDEDRMAKRPDLYFADPCFLFDYCKRHFSRNVALLHDYDLYDFTLLVRKHE
jgi:SAM-dependent methyltransferase